MKTLVHMEFGSKVYGTSVPTSDTDYKAVFVPDAGSILLQTAPRTISTNTKADKTARNQVTDVDLERFALHQYLKLLMQGQTVALDMLFAPSKFHTEKASGTWIEIQYNKNRFLHKGTTAFVGYARQQAAKYGIKGSRIAAVRVMLDFLSRFQPEERIYSLFPTSWPIPTELVNEYTQVVHIKGPNGLIEPHLEVCNRKIPFHATVKYAKSVFQKIFDEYGHRARLAETNEGIDWKALMHAVRVSCQAYELLSSGEIIFPRPEAALLLQIRKGELPYQQVAELIEQGLADLETIKEQSKLPATPDHEFADEIIKSVYGAEVIRQYAE